jgi:hypothetical protein
MYTVARRFLGVALAATLLVAAVSLTPTPAAGLVPGDPGMRAPAAVVGVVEVRGRPALAEVYVRMPAGVDEEEVVREALAAVGARPMTEADIATFGFTTFIDGRVWGQFQDRARRNDTVVQHYNPAGDPTAGAGLQALLNTHETWNSVRTSRFRFEFGGVTDRALDPFDGFNDVVWEDFGVEFVLGMALLAFTDTAIVEGDVVMNIGIAPKQWHTDGRDIDVEAVMLHENGHVLGLGHSDDFDAVMYPFYRAPQRELGVDDIAGVSFLYPTASGGGESNQRPASVPFRLLADSDLPFEVGDLNARGDASWSRYLFDGEQLVVARGGETRTVARTGDPAPGGGTLGLGILGRLALDASGGAAFAFALDPLGLPLGVNAGLYRQAGPGAPVMAVVPPGAGPFLGTRDADINDAGDVAFTGITATGLGTPEWPGMGAGVYVASSDGALRTVAAPGSPAPGGGRFTFAGNPSLNAAGDVAFLATLAGEPCDASNPAVFFACDAASLYVERRSGGTVRVAGRASRPVINDRGAVAFATPGGSLVVAAPDGTQVTVARVGDPMPEGGRVVALPSGPPGFTLNGRGDVVFNAVLDSVDPATALQEMGLYRWSGGRIDVLARTGSVVPDVGVIAQLSAPFRGTALGFSAAVSNDRGEVLFQATLTSGRGVLLVATGGDIDQCVDGLSASGEHLNARGNLTFDEATGTWFIAAQVAGAVCRRLPVDILRSDLLPHPEVESGQTIEATVRFNPAAGAVRLRVLGCSEGGTCSAEPLAVGAGTGEPGVLRVAYHNVGGVPLRVAVEVGYESGRAEVAYVLDARVNIPPPFVPPPLAECDDPGFRELTSPGDYHFSGTVCEQVPFNDFGIEISDRATLRAVSTTSRGAAALRFWRCGEEFCEPVVEGASDDGGLTQRAAWDNCSGAPTVLIVEVELVRGEPLADYELDIVAEDGGAACAALPSNEL